jgi:hypothetical protein
MPNRLGSHARHNVVAYLALFVAIGGTAHRRSATLAAMTEFDRTTG